MAVFFRLALVFRVDFLLLDLLRMLFASFDSLRSLVRSTLRLRVRMLTCNGTFGEKRAGLFGMSSSCCASQGYDSITINDSFASNSTNDSADKLASNSVGA